MQDRLSEQDRNEVLDWVETSDENRNRYVILKNIWMLSGILAEDQFETSELIRNKVNEITQRAHRYRHLDILRFAAAIIAIVTITGLASYFLLELRYKTAYNTTQKIVTPPGQRTEIEMSDGTKISLNSGTTLEFPMDWSSKRRNLRLSGEALFQVTSDINRPFIVTINDINVVATGTCFNINHKPKLNTVDITLIDGTLGIIAKDGSQLASLSPNQNAHISLTNDSLLLTSVDPGFYTSWKDGQIAFTNRRLEDIAIDLERWFNVEIQFANPNSKDIHYSGTLLKNKPIDQVLEILRLTSNFTYDIQIKSDKSSVITIK
ncbi:MAG: FecR family protein [Clostridiaceae bacterium]|nr:FecR family protein [Clostridiaceae bacterium]